MTRVYNCAALWFPFHLTQFHHFLRSYCIYAYIRESGAGGKNKVVCQLIQ